MNETLNPVEIEGQKYVRAIEAAEYLGLHLRTIHNMMDKGDLVTREAFGRRVIAIDSLESEKARRDAEKSEVAS